MQGRNARLLGCACTAGKSAYEGSRYGLLLRGSFPRGGLGYTLVWARQNCRKSGVSPWRAWGLGFARAPVVGEVAGRPRDLCTLAHAQPGVLAAGGRLASRSDPQPLWHRG
jgi:hypothetical protein